MDPSDDNPAASTDDAFIPTPFMPIDSTGGSQPILSGLTPLVPGVLIAQRYRLIKPTGRLGSASRWEATDESLSRSVMVLAFANDQNAPRILEAARQASGAMDARFLRILDAGQDADGAYIVSEWVQGRTLTELIAQNPLSSLESAWITREIAVGLDSVHPLRLYHLRLNPSDILITTNGSVKISGLMVEAALTERKDDQNLTRLDMEKLDVLGCGQILYACLTSTWPGTPVPGISAAQRTDAGLPTPVQVRPGTSVELNRITYQIMAPSAPNHLTSVKDVSEALSESLGSATGTAELARRANSAPEPPFPSEHGAATRPVILPATPAKSTPPTPTGSDNGEVSTQPIIDEPTTSAPPSDPSPQETGPEQPPRASGEAENPVSEAKAVTQKQVRRWSIGLIFLICVLVVAIITTTIVIAYKNSQVPPPPPLVERPVSQAIVFDPKNDGGNATENEDKTYLAFDGDLATVWPTADYNPGYITTVKPGVGLIFDLGEPVSVSQIEVATTIMPTTVQFYLPPDTTTTPDLLPMDTIMSWQAMMVSTTPATPSPAPASATPSFIQTLPIPQGGSPATVTIAPTTTRYILVYITQLQPGEDQKDHGNLAEVTFFGQ